MFRPDPSLGSNSANPSLRGVLARTLGVVGVFAAVVSTSGGSRAEVSSGARAQSLFDGARKLLAAGRVEEACAKFAESQRLGPAPGTLLNLAVCHEREGKLTTAREGFLEAEAAARKSGRKDREKICADHLKALEGRIPRLTVRVSSAARVDALQVMIDTTPLGESSWGTAIPIDPGEHVISASAPRKLTHEKRFALREAEHLELELPVLADSSPSPAPSGPARAEPAATSGSADGKRTAGYVLGAIGVVGVGVGTAFGLRAKMLWNDSNEGCPHGVCTAEGSQASHDAASSARVADIGFGIGIIGLAVGTVLVLTSRSPTSRTPVVSAHLSPHGARSVAATFTW